MSTKLNRKSKRSGLVCAVCGERVITELRNDEAAALQALGDELDTTLRRIGGYLAWVHRDVNVLRSHVTALQGKKGAKP